GWGARVAGGVPGAGGPGTGGGARDRVQPPALVTVPAWRHHDQPVVQVAYRCFIGVAKALGHAVGQPVGVLQLVARWELERGVREHVGHLCHAVSSAQTCMLRSTGPPKVVTIATSTASRPRPISTRPLRAALSRGSKVHHLPPRETSMQARECIT